MRRTTSTNQSAMAEPDQSVDCARAGHGGVSEDEEQALLTRLRLTKRDIPSPPAGLI